MMDGNIKLAWDSETKYSIMAKATQAVPYSLVELSGTNGYTQGNLYRQI
jgi:hypothetical protein